MSDRYALRALYETSQLLGSSLDLQFVLNNLLLISMTKVFVTRGLVLTYDPIRGTHRVATAKGLTAWTEGDELDLGGPPASSDELCDDDVPAPLAEHRIALLLPIQHHDRHIGYLALGRKLDGQPCQGAELEFVKSLVNISSAAVQNSLIVSELQQANRDLDAKIQELNTLFDLSQEFNATRERSRLVRLFSFALMGQLLVQRHLFLVCPPQPEEEEDDPEMVVVIAQGVDEERLGDEVIQEVRVLKSFVVRDDDAKDEPEQTLLRDLGLELLIPLRVRGKTQGALGLGRKMTGQRYEPDDLEFLFALGNLALTAVQNTYLVEEQIEKERLAQEMRLARSIQERLLPQTVPTAPGLDVAAYTTPSRDISGDYYDVLKLPDGRLVVAIADVTGKGVPASLLMANVQACLRFALPLELTLEDATTRINDVIHSNTGFDKFITFFWGIYHPESARFSYVNAGHDPPMLIRADGSLERLEAGGLLLGVFAGSQYERGEITLDAGDVLTLYTDGVSEAMNPASEEYTEERLLTQLNACHAAAAQTVANRIVTDVRRHTAGAPQSDDITLIVMKRPA
ncbi:MAG: SpoIIE family protein phosphatase [Bacteroidota bacterium]